MNMHFLNLRGDILRERSSKRKLLRDASSAITGLAFKVSASNVFLFVATDSSVFVYNTTHKDKEQKVSTRFANVLFTDVGINFSLIWITLDVNINAVFLRNLCLKGIS